MTSLISELDFLCFIEVAATGAPELAPYYESARWYAD